MRAAELLSKGMKPAEVARAVGSSRSSVTRWKAMMRGRGVAGLKAKPAPGRPPRLSKLQKRRLVRILLRGPSESGYPTDLWTCPRVAEVIERAFGVHYNPSYVWQILRRLGWTCQKPERQARERDEAAVQQWRSKDWPRIKKSPKDRRTHRFP
jgi:transposase